MKISMKNKKQGLLILTLIICNILLVCFTLFVTRTAIDDFENTIYSQRNHYKTYAITEMSKFYFRSIQENDSDGLSKFLKTTIHRENNEAGILCAWKPDEGFPVIWIGGNPDFRKYSICKSFKEGIKMSDSLGITPLKENLKVYQAISNYQTTNDRKPIIVNRGDGTKFLVTWVIIPSPDPKIAQYVFIVYTPTANLDVSIKDTREKYVWLFSGATLLAGMVLILIPIALTNKKKE
jgi:hypothetical protein